MAASARCVDLPRPVVAVAQLADPLRVDVEADDVEVPRQRDGQRQPDIAEPDDDDPAAPLMTLYTRSNRFGCDFGRNGRI